jgi:probable phosphoglycerate mutase
VAKRFILLRHGESESSARGIASGDPGAAVGRTAVGVVESPIAGVALRHVANDHCATSRFRRVRQTADLILVGRDLPRLELVDLDDMRGGQFEGRPLLEYRAWAGEHAMTEPMPGGESRSQLAGRYCRAMRELLDRDEETILVVAHGLPLSYVICAAAGELPQPVMRYLEYATPYFLAADAMERAVERLEAWTGGGVTP